MLVEEAEQQIDGSIRHIHNGLDTAAKLIVTCEEFGLPRQVFFDRLAHARVEELGMWGRIKEAVKICRVVQDFNIAIRCRPPIDRGQEPS